MPKILHAALLDLIPAHAGVIPTNFFLLKISASYPRARGGDPIWSNASL